MNDNVKICPKCHKQSVYAEHKQNDMWFHRCAMCNYHTKESKTLDEANENWESVSK